MKVSPEERALVLVIDKSISSDEAIFRYFAERLRFPSYFSYNWDSFDECLGDLAWVSCDVVIIFHKDWVNNPLRFNNIYVETVESIAKEKASKILLLYD